MSQCLEFPFFITKYFLFISVNGENKLKRIRPNQGDAEKQSENEDKAQELSDSSHDASDSPPPKSLKLRHVFRCPYCSYSADKLSSLNRHRRIHNRSSIPDSEKPTVPKVISRSETYCTSCNIQFSSIGTYNCHKEHYCSKREQQTSSPDSCSGENSQISNETNMVIPSLANSTLQMPAVELLQQQVMSGLSVASFLPSQTTVILAAPIVAPNGLANMTLGMPTVIVQPVVAAMTHEEHSKDQPTEAHQAKNMKQPKSAFTSSSEQPLDLSTSKNMKNDATSPATPGKSTPSSDTESSAGNVKVEPKSPASSPDSRRIVTPTSPQIGVKATSPKASPLTVPTVLPGLFPFKQVTQPAVVPQVPPSVSKCMECNIVFYKHENYMIHKEHYCSSRRNRSESPKEDVSFNRNATASHSSISNMELPQPIESKSPKGSILKDNMNLPVSVPAPVIEDGVVYRFYCIPCKIKFSSASTMKAHKEFYCPHGHEGDKNSDSEKNNDHEKLETVVKSDDEGQFNCTICGGVFSSSRLLKLHLCTGQSTQIPLLRCPCCDFVTQTEIRLSDHMKVHIPTKAYKCSICGYRGNTVRGMRMHGKMHIDNGEPFSDENMTEFEEPPLVPVQMNGHSDNGPLDVEAELIRLKNEPYKRRRSRKSYDKSEHAMYVTGPAVKSVCSLCRESFRDIQSFLMHMRLHEMAALEMAKNLRCRYCEMMFPSVESLVGHIQNLHSDRISPNSLTSPTRHSKTPTQSEVGDSDTSSSESNIKNRTGDGLNISVKQEPPDTTSDESVALNCSASDSQETNLIVHEKDSNLNISKNLIETHGSDCSTSPSHSENNCFVHPQKSPLPSGDENLNFGVENSHLKEKNERINFQIKTEPDENSVSSCSTTGEITSRMDSETEGKGVYLSSAVSECNSEASRSNEMESDTIKVEIDTDIPKTPETPETQKVESSPNKDSNNHSMIPNLAVFGAQSMLSMYQVPHTLASPPVSDSPTEAKISQTLLCGITETKPKYCKHCDIKFTYHTSFLAHKKYYCTAQPADVVSPSAVV